MYSTLLFVVFLGFASQAEPGVDAWLADHGGDIEAWSEASDMENLKYHWIDDTSNSVLDAKARRRMTQALRRQDHKMQRTLNTLESTLLRNTDSTSAAAFMICQNTVKYCEEYYHLGICKFAQWQEICVKTCDKEVFNCDEGEVESCGVVEAMTEEFKIALLNAIEENTKNVFDDTKEEVEQAFEDFEMMSAKPPSYDEDN